MRALLRVASPSSVFTATPHLLSWAFAQPLLVNIARAWVNDSLLVTGAGADVLHLLVTLLMLIMELSLHSFGSGCSVCVPVIKPLEMLMSQEGRTAGQWLHSLFRQHPIP